MLKLQVEGEFKQVEPFLHDLDFYPNLVVKKHEDFIKGVQPNDQISVTCYVQHANNLERRMRVAKLFCQNGLEIQIPLLDVIEVDMANGTWLITGKSYDIFADKKRAI